MWRAIDKEMDLKDCAIYSLSPEEEIYNEEEGVIWSFNYFFFNKTRKRVCYIYLRGLSIINQDNVPKTPLSEVGSQRSDLDWTYDAGASKRAKFWLGNRGPSVEIEGGWDEDDDDEMLACSYNKRVREPRLLPRNDHKKFVHIPSDPGSLRNSRSRSKSTVRGISEDIVESMEV